MIATVLAFLWRRHRFALCVCLLLPLLLGVLTGTIYPEIRAQREALEAIPFVGQFLQSAFVSPFSPISIFSLPYQHPLMYVMLAVYPSIPALGMPAAERGRGGLELLLASPLERGTLVTSLAVFVLMTAPLLLCASFAGTLIGGVLGDALDALPLARYWLAGLNCAALMAAWGGAAALISVVSDRRGSATLTYAAVVATAFVFDSAAKLAPTLGWLADWTPYGYIRPADIAGGSSAWRIHSLALAGLAVVLFGLARWLQMRRTDA